MLVFFLLQIAVCLAARVPDTPVSCSAGIFTKGKPGRIICSFHKDLREQASIVKVTFYKNDALQGTDVLLCAQTRFGEPECRTHGDYQYNGDVISVGLSLIIRSVDDSHAGTYLCQAQPIEVEPQSCILEVTEEDLYTTTVVSTTHGNVQPEDLEEAGENGCNERMAEKDTIILGLGIGLGAAVAVIIALIVVLLLVLCCRHCRQEPDSRLSPSKSIASRADNIDAEKMNTPSLEVRNDQPCNEPLEAIDVVQDSEPQDGPVHTRNGYLPVKSNGYWTDQSRSDESREKMNTRLVENRNDQRDDELLESKFLVPDSQDGPVHTGDGYLSDPDKVNSYWKQTSSESSSSDNSQDSVDSTTPLVTV